MNEITLPQEEFQRLLAEAKQEGGDERRAFIRRAALGLSTSSRGLGPEDAWALARKLWDAKPEDC